MSNVLERIVEKKHYSFIDGKGVTWQEAVRLSALPLVEDGSVDGEYYKQIVACIEKHGPYIVLEHNIAMPHTTENPVGAYKTGVGFMVSENMIDFGQDEDGEKKEANLLFTLSAVNSDEHMENISQLMDVFMNYDLIEALGKCRSAEDILDAMKKYPCNND
jgi:PTS system ascorbate-specific IIA component